MAKKKSLKGGAGKRGKGKNAEAKLMGEVVAYYQCPRPAKLAFALLEVSPDKEK